MRIKFNELKKKKTSTCAWESNQRLYFSFYLKTLDYSEQQSKQVSSLKINLQDGKKSCEHACGLSGEVKRVNSGKHDKCVESLLQNLLHKTTLTSFHWESKMICQQNSSQKLNAKKYEKLRTNFAT